MSKRKGPSLTKPERAIADAHFDAYMLRGELIDVAIEKAMFETREHVLKTFEVYIGGDPTCVFVDVQAKSDFLALVRKLRGQR